MSQTKFSKSRHKGFGQDEEDTKSKQMYYDSHRLCGLAACVIYRENISLVYRKSHVKEFFTGKRAKFLVIATVIAPC